MLCPLCRARAPKGQHVCPACGVDFMKWLRLQGGKAAAKPRRGRPRWPWAAALAAAGLAALVVSLRPRPAAPRSSAPRPAAPAAPAAEDRLAELYRQARAEFEVYGLELPAAELAGRYRAGRQGPGEEAEAALAAELGLPPPRAMPLGATETARHAKCLKGGAWVYGALPAHPEAGVECWAAVNERPRRWVLQHWQPRLKRWSPWTEDELARILRRRLESAYSARREQEARQALVAGGDKRAALLEYWGLRAEREGALAALEGP